MPFRAARHIEPEILDDQSPEAAAPSLRDLIRINRFLGGHEVLRRALRRIGPPGQGWSLLDVGAGSADAAGIVHKEWPGVHIVSLDYRLHHVRNAPGQAIVADAFRMPFPPRSFDVVYSGLFLHHFPNEQVVGLLAAMRALARRWVIVNDLERHVLPWAFLPATRFLFRWHPVTLHDGPISVQAGFKAAELKDLATQAGLKEAVIRTHRPSFRLSLIAPGSGDTLRV
jgi:SAM-dependent methyltransferase